jgi:hypothetical protein
MCRTGDAPPTNTLIKLVCLNGILHIINDLTSWNSPVGEGLNRSRRGMAIFALCSTFRQTPHIFLDSPILRSSNVFVGFYPIFLLRKLFIVLRQCDGAGEKGRKRADVCRCVAGEDRSRRQSIARISRLHGSAGNSTIRSPRLSWAERITKHNQHQL